MYRVSQQGRAPVPRTWPRTYRLSKKPYLLSRHSRTYCISLFHGFVACIDHNDPILVVAFGALMLVWLACGALLCPLLACNCCGCPTATRMPPRLMLLRCWLVIRLSFCGAAGAYVSIFLQPQRHKDKTSPPRGAPATCKPPFWSSSSAFSSPHSSSRPPTGAASSARSPTSRARGVAVSTRPRQSRRYSATAPPSDHGRRTLSRAASHIPHARRAHQQHARPDHVRQDSAGDAR